MGNYDQSVKESNGKFNAPLWQDAAAARARRTAQEEEGLSLSLSLFPSLSLLLSLSFSLSFSVALSLSHPLSVLLSVCLYVCLHLSLSACWARTHPPRTRQ